MIQRNKRKIFPRSVMHIAVFILSLVLVPFVSFSSEAYEGKKVRNSQMFAGELLIKLKPSVHDKLQKDVKPTETGISSLDSLNRSIKVEAFTPLIKEGKKNLKDKPINRWYRVSYPKIKNEKIIDAEDKEEFAHLQLIIERYKNDPNVETVTPNHVMRAQVVPNDPYYATQGSWGQAFDDLWGLKKINSEPAWDLGTGSHSIIVANIDTGVDRNHPDLQTNMWVNTNETPNNNLDDDGNGYIDDYYGWDFANNDNDPMDDQGHGTHTAGSIAAIGNNSLGVVGVSWRTKIMALKFLGGDGSGSEADAAEALYYAANMGADISSNSWGCDCQSQIVDDAVKYEHDSGMTVIVAAANSNTDALDFSPAASVWAMTVAASDVNDIRAAFSNWGEKIDVAAPGVEILSLRAAGTDMYGGGTHFVPQGNPNASYYRASGTSMAAPHVAGLAGLLLAKEPTLTNEEIRQIIRRGATDLGNPGKDRDFGYGRINAENSMNNSSTKPLTPTITTPVSRSTISGANYEIRGSVSGPNFASYKIEVGYGRTPTVWTQVATSSSQVTDGVLATIDTKTLKDGKAIFRVSATATDGKTYQFQVHDIEIDNIDAEITLPLLFVPKGQVKVYGTARVKNGTFARYDLHRLDAFGANPTSAGITLANNGTVPVVNGLLGTWDTSTLPTGQKYHIRLTVHSYDAYVQVMQPVIVDPDLVNNWPQRVESVYDTGLYHYSTPATADLTGDGNKEIVVLEPAGRIKVLRKDGSLLPGFPVTVDAGYFFNDPVTLSDLDGDNKPEIIATATNRSHNVKHYILKGDGSFYPGWPKPQYYSGYGFNDASISVGDLNRDGTKDLIFTDSNGNIHALNLNGNELAGFPKKVFPTSHYGGTPSLADLDNDGRLEIAIASTDFATGASKVYLLDNTGTVLPGWPYTAPQYNGYPVFFESALASGDVDGDGRLELIGIGNQHSCPPSPLCDGHVFGWRKNGTLLPGLPKVEGTYTNEQSKLNSPALADLDNDGKDEIVIGTYGIRVYGWINGTISKKFEDTSSGNGSIAPAIADVDGDGKLEILSIYNYRLRIVDDNGTAYWQKELPYADSPYNVYKFLSPGVLSDLDNDGQMELIAVHNLARETKQTNAFVYMWQLPRGAAASKFEWPQFLQNESRNGRLVTRAETIPPTVAITSPANNATVSRNSTVTITATANDASGVTKVEFYVNGVLKCTDTTASYTCGWQVPSARGATYTLQAKAYDTLGNIGTHTVTVRSSLLF